MVDDKDDIIDKFKDIDNSKEIRELQKPKESKTVKARDNKDYDNFGFHWYPKQTPSSKGALFGLAICGLGILILIIQVILFDVYVLFSAIIFIISGWILACHFAANIEKEKQRKS